MGLLSIADSILGTDLSGKKAAAAAGQASDAQVQAQREAMEEMRKAYAQVAPGMAQFMLPQHAQGFGFSADPRYGQQNPNAPMMMDTRENIEARYREANPMPTAPTGGGMGGMGGMGGFEQMQVQDPMGRNRTINVPAGKKIQWDSQYTSGSSPGEFGHTLVNDPDYQAQTPAQQGLYDDQMKQWQAGLDSAMGQGGQQLSDPAAQAAGAEQMGAQGGMFGGLIDRLKEKAEGGMPAGGTGTPMGGMGGMGGEYDPSQYGLDPLSQLRASQGIFGSDAQKAFYDNFQEDPGTQFLRDQGIGDINAQMAARGGLGGASRLKSISEFNQGLANQQLSSRLQNLASLGQTDMSLAQNLANMRLGQAGNMAGSLNNIGAAQAGGIMGAANARQQGMNNLIGIGSAAAGFGFSDASLKTNVKHVGTENGHNVYTWDWLDRSLENEPSRGVIAQEVILTRPDCVEVVAGYYAVNYERLGVKYG